LFYIADVLMPELPEVETMRRGILVARGATVVAARRPRSRKKPLQTLPAWPAMARQLAGQQLKKIDRHGKRLLLGFASGRCLIIEPRMSGLVLVGQPPDPESVRLELDLKGGRCRRLTYWDRRGLGRLILADEQATAEYLSPQRLGPDALDISEDELRENLGHRDIPVKVALMDQKAVAGIGNIYASEILHAARVDPRRRCSSLRRPRWRAIHAAMLEVLNEAIRLEGSTLSDGSYRNAMNRPGSYQNRHRVYDRMGESCPRCGGSSQIERIVQAQRSTYFCPRCQR
jgi:formamidopyrimidine-DNA glycosylase